jgi:hypothetical protein
MDIQTTIKETTQGTKRIDETDFPFISDETIIGRWVYSDFVKSPDNFKPGVISFLSEPYLKEIVFMSDGSIMAAFESNNLLAAHITWTKEAIINKQDEFTSSYLVENIDGEDYLFYEWKCGDYSYRSMEPWFYVFKKDNTYKFKEDLNNE